MKYHRCLLVLILIAMLLVSCSTPSQTLSLPGLPAPDYWPVDGWKTSAPEEQGMDVEKLADMLDYVQSNAINLHSLLVIRNGYIVLEGYANPYTPDVRHTVESNTKSIIGALIGIAINQGKMKDAQARMVDFFPDRMFQNTNRQKQSIQLSHLLTMSSGLDCADMSAAAQEMYNTRNWAGYLMDLPMVSSPGMRFAYCSGGVHILSDILQTATGSPAREYANQYLFQPLGIPQVSQADWQGDPNGITNGIAGLYLTPRELAKFGFLYLHRGQWNGAQVVPAEWVDASTRSQITVARKDGFAAGLRRDFGYLFSIFPEQKFYGYLGRAGQDMFIVPDQNLVVVFNSGMKVGDEGSLLNLMTGYILPAVQPGTAAADPAKSQHLKAALEKFAGEALPVPQIPQAALDASGKVFQFAENPLGWKSASFSFVPGANQAGIVINGEMTFQAGLDNRFRLNTLKGSRPVGVRGRWAADGAFQFDYMTLGDFSEISGNVEFKGNEIMLTIRNKNTGGEPNKLVGKRN